MICWSPVPFNILLQLISRPQKMWIHKRLEKFEMADLPRRFFKLIPSPSTFQRMRKGSGRRKVLSTSQKRWIFKYSPLFSFWLMNTLFYLMHRSKSPLSVELNSFINGLLKRVRSSFPRKKCLITVIWGERRGPHVGKCVRQMNKTPGRKGIKNQNRRIKLQPSTSIRSPFKTWSKQTINLMRKKWPIFTYTVRTL